MIAMRLEDDPAIRAALNEPENSVWFQAVLQSAFPRNPVDVLNDLERAAALVKANVGRRSKRVK